jgi:1-acyl-sn-glycerol-3-phosphate acyltransferase
MRAWQTEILAWHRTDGCSNRPTEAINLLLKKVKRVGHGFRNFANDRLWLLLHCGVRWQTHRTARLRSRSPRLVASSPTSDEAADTFALGVSAALPVETASFSSPRGRRRAR